MHEKPGMRSSAGWLVGLLLAIVLLNACGGAPAPAAEAPTGAPAAATAPTAAAHSPTPAEAAQPTAAAQPAAPAGTLRRDRKTLVVAYQESADNLDPAQTLNVANNIITRPI